MFPDRTCSSGFKGLLNSVFDIHLLQSGIGQACGYDTKFYEKLQQNVKKKCKHYVPQKHRESYTKSLKPKLIYAVRISKERHQKLVKTCLYQQKSMYMYKIMVLHDWCKCR